MAGQICQKNPSSLATATDPPWSDRGRGQTHAPSSDRVRRCNAVHSFAIKHFFATHASSLPLRTPGLLLTPWQQDLDVWRAWQRSKVRSRFVTCHPTSPPDRFVARDHDVSQLVLGRARSSLCRFKMDVLKNASFLTWFANRAPAGKRESRVLREWDIRLAERRVHPPFPDGSAGRASTRGHGVPLARSGIRYRTIWQVAGDCEFPVAAVKESVRKASSQPFKGGKECLTSSYGPT